MQEFSSYICMLVRFNMTKPDNLASITELSLMLPNSNSWSLICLSDASVKKTDCIFFAKGIACVSKEQLPHHWLTLQNAYLSPRSRGLISEWFVGLEGRHFHPVTYFQLHWTILTFLGVFPVQSVTLHPPRTDQEQSQGSFIEGGSHTKSKRLPLDTFFVVLTGENNPLLCHPWKLLPLSHTLSPHNVSPFQKLAFPFSGTASQCNILQEYLPEG